MRARELFLYTANRKQHNNTMLLGAVNSHGTNDSKTKYTIHDNQMFRFPRGYTPTPQMLLFSRNSKKSRSTDIWKKKKNK